MGRRNMVRLFACLLMLVVAGGCDWLQSGYGPGDAYYNPETNLTSANVGELSAKFTISTAGRSYAAPIIVGNTLYMKSFESATGTVRLEAFDTTSGSPVFSTTLATGASQSSSLAEDGGEVYVATDTSTAAPTLFAVSASSGSISWSLPLGTDPSTDLAGGLTIDNGIVFAMAFIPAGAITDVVAVDTATQALKWTYVAGTGTVEGGDYTAATRGGLLAVTYVCCTENTETGPVEIPATAIVRESDGIAAQGGAEFEYFPTAANGLLYGGVFDQQTGTLNNEAFDPTTDSVIWALPASGGMGAFPAVSGASAILTDAQGTLTAYDAHTGAVQWTIPPVAGTFSTSPPAIAGGLVFFVTSEGGTSRTLRVYDAHTGAPVAAIPVATSTVPRPIVANGQVYIGDGTSISVLGLP